MKSKNIIFKSGITLVVSLLFFVNVFSQNNSTIKTGYWKGVLTLHEKQSEYGLIELPFYFEAKIGEGTLYLEIINAEERIRIDEISFRGDSLFIKMPVFDSEFKCIKIEQGKIQGSWINHSRKDKNVIAFSATFIGKEIPHNAPTPKSKIEGKWEVDFSPNSEDNSKAIGLFKEEAFNTIKGTFLTESGDYRYLSGDIKGNNFNLSCFDGSHAFVFNGEIKNDSIVNGNFYSGVHWHEPWVAKRNNKFELHNPDSLTFLKPGFTKVDFSFKNLEGKQISLSDEKFKNKVVIIQIMGSWCPNCMDETKFLSAFYDEYKPKGLEVIGLAFERTDDFAKAVSNVQRLKTRFDANYEFLITMKTGAQQASEALPMLSKVMAFPTTIYIDKKGIVRKIYTGFYGPATGEAYTKYVAETTHFVEKLLSE
jgi:thiol-disulfide isomerase/thioredoxin